MTTDSPAADSRLRRSVLIAFILPTLVLGIMHGPEGQLQAIYAKHGGVALTALAAAVLLSKMFDAITYPLIGYFSDRTFARSGTRKGWVIGGTAVSVLGVWMLMRPPAQVDAVYFGIWMGVTYLGWKLMEIPLQAWSYGLSTDYAQRARVQTWRGMAALAGALLFFAIPFLAVQVGASQSTELNFDSLGVTAILCAIALPLAALICVTLVPNGTAALPAPAPKRPGLSEVYKALRGNGPLLHLLAAFVPVSVLGGLMNGVAYLYIDTYLGLAKQFPAVMGVAMLTSIFGLPFWGAMSARFERHRLWAVSLIGGGIACLGLALLTPGPLALPLIFVIYPLATFSLGGVIIVLVMSADIVDYGRLLTGEDHAGLYGSIFAFLQKSLLGVSAALGLAMAGWFGFDATAATQSASGVFGIKLTGAVLPGLGLLGAAVAIWNYPLGRARVAEIQAQLAQRKTA